MTFDSRIPTLALAGALALALTGALVTGSANAQSFACMGRLTLDEATVCADPRLAAADERMAAAYTRLLDILKKVNRSLIPDVRDGQRDFLARRAACGADAACMLDEYAERYTYLRRLGNTAQNQ